MSLIFDSFPSRADATRFAESIRATFGKEANVYDSQEISDRADPFPFTLKPPIVLVERYDDYPDDLDRGTFDRTTFEKQEFYVMLNVEKERELQAHSKLFGGRCAGT